MDATTSSTHESSSEAASNSLLSKDVAYVGRARIIITASYFGCFGSVGICLASLGPILLGLSRQLGTSLDALGNLFVVRACGYLIGSGVSGYLVDRIRHTHAMLLLAMGLCAAGTALIPVLPTHALVAAAVSTQGVCMGVLDTGGNVLLIWLHGSGTVEPYMQAMHFCFGLGAFVAPLLVELSVQRSGGFAAAFYCIGAMLLFWCVHRWPHALAFGFLALAPSYCGP